MAIHKTALIDENVVIGKHVTISSGCVIYPNCEFGDNVFIGHNTILQSNTIVGDNSYIGGLVNCEGDVTIGKFCGINAQCHLTKYMKIGNYTFFGPMICTVNDKDMNYRREGHGSNLQGPIIGDYVRIGALSLLMSGITIGDNATIGAMSLVLKNIPANSKVKGHPAYCYGLIDI